MGTLRKQICIIHKKGALCGIHGSMPFNQGVNKSCSRQEEKYMACKIIPVKASSWEVIRFERSDILVLVTRFTIISGSTTHHIVISTTKARRVGFSLQPHLMQRRQSVLSLAVKSTKCIKLSSSAHLK